MSNRICWIDAVKGIGILFVMFIHTFASGISAKLMCFGYMQMFFIVSGYTLHYNKSLTFSEGLKCNLSKKAKQLIIPYFFYGILSLSMVIIFDLLRGRPFNYNYLFGLFYSRNCLYPIDCSHNLDLLSFNGPLWFLTAMFMTYIWVYIYLYTKSLKIRVVELLLLLIVSIAMAHLPVLLPWSIDTSGIGCIMVLIGYFSYSKINNIKRRSIPLVLVIFTLVYVILVRYNTTVNMSVRVYGDNKSEFVNIISFILLGVIEGTIFSLVFKLTESSLITHLLSKIGRMSLRIMCIHSVVFTVLSNVLHVSLANTLVSIVFIIFVILVSELFGKFLDKSNFKFNFLKYI